MKQKFQMPVNHVDITTIEPDGNNKAYLIDKRLLDMLLVRVTVGSLDDIKEDIKEEVLVSKTKEELFKRLDDFIYLDKIVQLAMPSVIDDVANNKIPVDSPAYRPEEPVRSSKWNE